MLSGSSAEGRPPALPAVAHAASVVTSHGAPVASGPPNHDVGLGGRRIVRSTENDGGLPSHANATARRPAAIKVVPDTPRSVRRMGPPSPGRFPLSGRGEPSAVFQVSNGSQLSPMPGERDVSGQGLMRRRKAAERHYP